MISHTEMKRYIIMISFITMCFALSISAQNALNLGDIQEIRSLDLNPTNNLLAVGGRYNNQSGIWFYDIGTATIIDNIPTETNVFTLSWRPDGNAIAVAVAGANRELIQVYDYHTKQLVVEFDQGPTSATEIRWNTSNNQIITGLGEQIFTRNATTGDIVTTMQVPSSNMSFLESIAWDDTNSRVYGLVDTAQKIFVWDSITGVVLQEYAIPYYSQSLALSHDGEMLAVGSLEGEGRIQILNSFTGDILLNIQGVSQEFTNALLWSPDNTNLAGYTSNNTSYFIRVWDLSGNNIHSIELDNYISPSTFLWNHSGNGFIFSTDQAMPRFVIPPIANAGSNQTITESDNNGSEVMLDASLSSDIDGTIVSYEWRENGTVVATGVNSQVNLGVGVHEIILTVTDEDGATGRDIVVITVEAP